MKKSFLLILASLFAIFALAGCADDSKNDTPVVTPVVTATPIDLSSMEKYPTLVGTYEITFFYTNGAGAMPLSNDCASVPTYVTGEEACAQSNQVAMQGRGVISMDLATQTGKLVTKIQMTNDTMKNASGFLSTLSDQQYNYTVFTDIPLSAISANGVNLDHAVKGTSGRNLTKLITPTETPAYPSANNSANTDYSFTVDPNDSYTLINTMTDRSNILAAKVTVRMKKISDIPETLDANVPFDTPAIEGFVANPQ